ncbi:MAG: EF-hand domain-containing protein [Xanthomonadales bacterium]|nr:EF-hand domain-containing protein [Xanthomonadales bacterium]
MLVAPALTRADSLPQSPAAYLARMDLDGNGVVDLAEYRDYMSRGFRRMDRNGDGILEDDELPVPDARVVRLQVLLDALEHSFRRLDRNGDGVLDARELASPP